MVLVAAQNKGRWFHDVQVEVMRSGTRLSWHLEAASKIRISHWGNFHVYVLTIIYLYNLFLCARRRSRVYCFSVHRMLVDFVRFIEQCAFSFSVFVV